MQYKHFVAVLYTIVLFLDRLDLTIVNVTLPTVARYFGVTILETDWVSMSFLLALAISIPISGWLGDRFGLKKIFIIALIIFGLGSSLCAWVDTLNQLIFFRFLHGIGGGLLIPVGMTMLYRIYDKSEYANITSFVFLPSLIAPAIAPFIGGLILENISWQFVFIFAGPICLILTIIALIFLKDDNFKIKKRLDWIGFLISSILLVTIFLTLSAIKNQGFSLISLSEIIAIIILIISFIKWEKRVKHPLFNLDLFKSPIFIGANLLQICFQICLFGAMFLIGIYLQIGIGFSAVITGAMMGMQAIGAMITMRYSVKLFHKYGPKFPIIIGLSGVIILSPAILLIQNSSLSMIIFGGSLFLIRGVFTGLCGAPIHTLSIIDFSKDQIGQANSLFNACRHVSITLGVSLSTILLSIGLKFNHLNAIEDLQPSQVFNVFIFGFLAISMMAMIGIYIAIKIENYNTR